MSSPSEQSSIAYVVVGAVRDPGIDALVTQLGDAVDEVRLSGAPGDGRRLLEVIASCDQVLFSGGINDGGNREHER